MPSARVLENRGFDDIENQAYRYEMGVELVAICKTEDCIEECHTLDLCLQIVERAALTSAPINLQMKHETYKPCVGV